MAACPQLPGQEADMSLCGAHLQGLWPRFRAPGCDCSWVGRVCPFGWATQTSHQLGALTKAAALCWLLPSVCLRELCACAAFRRRHLPSSRSTGSGWASHVAAFGGAFTHC